MWRPGHPEDVATVRVDDDADTLQIQPGAWVSDIGVQYSGAAPVGEFWKDLTCALSGVLDRASALYCLGKHSIHF